MSESETSAHERVKSKFDKSRNYAIGIGEGPDKASQYATDQTLLPGGLDEAEVDISDLTLEESAKIAQVLIEGYKPRIREIVEEFKKGEYGDPAEQLDFSGERVQRILASAKRILDK